MGARPALCQPPPSPVARRSRESPKVCALRNAPLVPLPAGVAGPGNGEAAARRSLVTVQPQRARTARGPGDGLRQQVRAWGCARPARPPRSLPAPLPTYRAAGRCAGVAGAERLVHLLRLRPGVLAGRGALRLVRGEARPELGGLACAPPGGRLHLLSESLSHVCGGCSCPGGGGAGLGAIIWEDAVPCPAGAVVSPLKKPAPHCSPAAAAGSRGRPAQRGEEGAAAPAPGRCRPRRPCPAAAPGGVRIQPAPGDGRRFEAAGAGMDREDSRFLSARMTAVCQIPAGSRLTASPGLSMTQRLGPTRYSVSYTDQ